MSQYALRIIPVDNARPFQRQAAAVLAAHSALAYRRGPDGAAEIRATLVDAGFPVVHLFGFGEPGLQCYIARGDQGMVLAFRGTEPDRIEDILTDLRADLVAPPGLGGARVHRGFWRSYATAAPWIAERLSGFGGPLFITGHSLGGALAVLAAADLAPRSLAAVYTFGAPRVGTVELEARLAGRPVYRVVRCADIVPRRPALLLLAGYRHLGDLRYLDWQGRLHTAPGAAARLVDRTIARLVSGRALRIAVDHHAAADYAAILARL